MKTERPGLSPLELRAHLTALLAAVYTIAWRAIGGHASTPAAPPPVISARPSPSRPQWLDEIPPDRRPVVSVPAGWQIGGRTSPAPALVRAPARAVHRVRTRSS